MALFVLTLVLDRRGFSHFGAPEPEVTTETKMAQHKILLVDNDAPARDALERALLEANYRVVSALNGSDALHQIQRHSIDVAVLALGRGRDAENDWSTAQRLTQYQPRLRLIVASADSEGFAHPLASTAEALLEKPIDLPLLFETLKSLPGLPGHSCVSEEPVLNGACHCHG